jgi:hypothetical protein
MSNLFVMAVSNRFTYLLEQKAASLLRQLFAPPNIAQEIPASTKLHYKAHMIFAFKRVIQLYNVFVLEFVQKIHFIF